MDTTAKSQLGTAVLVHALWSNPGDWRLVRPLLEDRGIHVETPDLPTHRRRDAGLPDDAEEVRAVIRSSTPPVVVVGWAYGGDVVGMAADGEPNVARLIYVATGPKRIGSEERYPGWLDGDGTIRVDREQGVFWVSDEGLMFEENGVPFPPEIQEDLTRNKRRPAAIRAFTDPITAEAWKSIPTTVILGRHDQITPESHQHFARTFDDVREVEAGLFIPFTHPRAIADAVVEALEEARQRM